MVDTADKSIAVDSDELLKVMVVDDNPFNRDIINEYMEEEGFETICVEHAIAAIDYLECNADANIDVILLDRMMPYMNGIEMVEKLKANVLFRHIPIIMVSAAAEQSQINEGRKSGVYDYLTKPFERAALLSLVRKAADESEHLRNIT